MPATEPAVEIKKTRRFIIISLVFGRARARGAWRRPRVWETTGCRLANMDRLPSATSQNASLTSGGGGEDTASITSPIVYGDVAGGLVAHYCNNTRPRQQMPIWRTQSFDDRSSLHTCANASQIPGKGLTDFLHTGTGSKTASPSFPPSTGSERVRRSTTWPAMRSSGCSKVVNW